MKKFWKVLGIAALAVGLTPHHISKDEETGEQKIQALLWEMTRTPKPDSEEKEEIAITLGFNPPYRREEEAHLFSDDLSVEYATVPVTAEEAEDGAAGAGETEETEAAEEEAAAAEAEAPQEESSESAQP